MRITARSRSGPGVVRSPGRKELLMPAQDCLQFIGVDVAKPALALQFPDHTRTPRAPPALSPNR